MPQTVAIDWQTILGTAVQNGVIYAVPLMLAGNGELIAERSGVVNVGIEGMMLTGAFTAALTAAAIELHHTGALGPWVGVATAVAAGALLAGLFGLFTVRFRVDQIVAGLAINILALGLTGLLYSNLRPHFPGQRIETAGLSKLELPGSAHVPAALAIAAEQPILTYVAFLAVILTGLVVARTRVGVLIRAVGESPEAVDTAGLSVPWTRFWAVVVGGAFAGAAGGYLSLAANKGFQVEMTAGRGFVALALVIFAKWRAGWLVPATILFGLLSSGQQVLKLAAENTVDLNVYYPLFSMIPYVLTLLVLAGLVGRARAPAALGRPYVRH